MKISNGQVRTLSMILNSYIIDTYSLWESGSSGSSEEEEAETDAEDVGTFVGTCVPIVPESSY